MSGEMREYTPEELALVSIIAKRISLTMVECLDGALIVDATLLHCALGVVLEHTFRLMSSDDDRLMALHAFISRLELRVALLLSPVTEKVTLQ